MASAEGGVHLDSSQFIRGGLDGLHALLALAQWPQRAQIDLDEDVETLGDVGRPRYG